MKEIHTVFLRSIVGQKGFDSSSVHAYNLDLWGFAEITEAHIRRGKANLA